MNNNVFIKKLHDAFSINGLDTLLTYENADTLYKLTNTLVETNKLYNLTAITDDDGIILKHFIDCATVLMHIPENAHIIDVGCGAGFPSLPIAILRQDVYVTSLDSTAKKINFINMTAQELKLGNIKAITARAEDHAKANRESYDVAISRAVARLNVLDEICIPLIKPDGLFIAMKSSKGGEEFEEARKGIGILGARFLQSDKKILEYGENKIEREIYIFKKEKTTPSQYPRNYSQIIRKPL